MIHAFAETRSFLPRSSKMLRVAPGHGKRFAIGTLFIDDAIGKEVMKVVGINDEDMLHLERGYAKTEIQEHKQGFKIKIIANPDDIKSL